MSETMIPAGKGLLCFETAGNCIGAIAELFDRHLHAVAVSSDTGRGPLFITYETVAGETPASLATSSRVIAMGAPKNNKYFRDTDCLLV